MGPIDWTHAALEKHPEEAALLRRVEQDPTRFGVSVAFMCPYRRILEIGMYDGWPYWSPYPSYCTVSPLGGIEWLSFNSIDSIHEFKEGES
jgi:hypothetical protein